MRGLVSGVPFFSIQGKDDQEYHVSGAQVRPTNKSCLQLHGRALLCSPAACSRNLRLSVVTQEPAAFEQVFQRVLTSAA